MAADSYAIPVRLAGQPYEVRVRPGILADAGKEIASLTASRRAMLLSDSNTSRQFGPALRDALASAGVSLDAECVIPAGEEHKTLDQIARAYDAFLRAKIERNTTILALGGGVIGDMAGFVAATLLRGVPFVQIPTSLLAMVDASVGGKTGVNHAVGKNLIGAFHQPLVVLVDPHTLKTLPARELRGGLAECIKHDIIRDPDGFARLEEHAGKALSLDVRFLADLVAHNVAIKARVVEADPFENGDRAHLNFGHTFGHAIENVSHYEYSHGESVALGMAAASQLAVELNMLDASARERIVALIEKVGLPARGLTLDVNAVVDAMAFDKKVKSGKIRFILPDRIGHVVIRDDVPLDLVRRCVEAIR